MSSGCLDDLQVLKASENKRDHRLLHELETLLNGGRVSCGFLVWAGVAAFVGWVVFGYGAGYKNDVKCTVWARILHPSTPSDGV